MNYPKRTDFNEQLGEGANCIFDLDKNHCITVTWTGKKYKIILAWIERDMGILSTFPEYPFIKTKADRSIVTHAIQSDCNHAEWDYYPEHKVCMNCEVTELGDFAAEAKKQQQEIAAKIKENGSKPLKPESKPKQEVKIITKVCNFRLHPYIKREEEFVLHEAWICLLTNCDNFRKKCSDFDKQGCQYAEEIEKTEQV